MQIVYTYMYIRHIYNCKQGNCGQYISELYEAFEPELELYLGTTFIYKGVGVSKPQPVREYKDKQTQSVQ